MHSEDGRSGILVFSLLVGELQWTLSYQLMNRLTSGFEGSTERATTWLWLLSLLLKSAKLPHHD